MRKFALVLSLLGTAALTSRPAVADCRLEIELLGADLKGLPLTEPQKQQLAPLVDDALKHCRIAREGAALALIVKARRIAGIEVRDDEPDPPPGKP